VNTDPEGTAENASFHIQGCTRDARRSAADRFAAGIGEFLAGLVLQSGVPEGFSRPSALKRFSAPSNQREI